MKETVKGLASRNGFTYHEPGIRDYDYAAEQVASEVKDHQFVATMTSLARPTVYIRHFHFVNLGQPFIKYFNTGRDPIERFVSAYEFRRAWWQIERTRSKYKTLKKRGLIGHNTTLDQWRQLDINKCILSNYKECAMKTGSPQNDTSIAYLCGQDKKCAEVGSQWARETAMRNVEEHYPVVGVLEMMDQTRVVLEKEKEYGELFRGIWNQTVLHENRTDKKNKISDEARQELARRLKEELKFYEWLTRRLDKQYRLAERRH